MNSVVIILGIVIIILFYVLYMYYSNKATTLLENQVNLIKKEDAIEKIASPTNRRYAYGIWIYVNSWDPNDDKTIFSRDNNLNLYLDKLTPTLNVEIAMAKKKKGQTMVVTNNFPLQKWVYIIVSVDNQFVDVYLDGKLVKSQRFIGTDGEMPMTPPDEATYLYVGNSNQTPFSKFDAFVCRFFRWTVPMDPQTAWSYYMAGNGQSNVIGGLAPYGANLSILQNNVTKATYTLF